MIDPHDALAVARVLEEAAECLRSSPLRSGSHVRLPARGRLIATGDLHDNPAHLAKILKIARPEDDRDRHVVLHEMIHSDRLVNGVDLSHRVLVRVAELVRTWPGQVHPLLANHELAQMRGKGISKGAGDSVLLFNDGLEYAFGDDWMLVSDAIGVFIRAFPLALRSDSGVLCAHSLPSPQTMKWFDPGVLDRDLDEADYDGPEGSAYLMVWGRRHTPEQIRDLAERWGVRIFCLGHEHVEFGFDVHGDRVVILNSDHEHACILPMDLAQPPSVEQAALLHVPLSAIDLIGEPGG